MSGGGAVAGAAGRAAPGSAGPHAGARSPGPDSPADPEGSNSNSDSMSSFSVPGVSEFAPLQPAQSPPAWGRGLAPEDINYMHQLGSLTTSGLIIEVKKLHDLAYQLGLEEAKEMTRGKYLNIFTSRRPR